MNISADISIRNQFFNKLRKEFYQLLPFFVLLSSILLVISNAESLIILYSKSGHSSKLTFYSKVLRELFIYGSFIGIYFSVTDKKFHLINSIFLILLTCFSINAGLYTLLWGFRFLLPLFILMTPIIVSPRIGSRNTLKKTINAVFWIHLTLQIIHFFFGKGFFAFFLTTFLNARNPGLYFFPAASGFLTLSIFSFNFSLSKKPVHLFATCLSIFLCSSITGLVTFLAMVFVIKKDFSKQKRFALLAYFVLSFSFLHLARYSMTGNKYLEETAGGRLKLMSNFFNQANFNFQTDNFGTATNGAAVHLGGPSIDSLYTAVFYNLGLVWTLILSGLFCYYFYIQRFDLRNRGIQLLITSFLLCSIGLITSEVSYPFFLLYLSKVFALEGDL